MDLKKLFHFPEPPVDVKGTAGLSSVLVLLGASPDGGIPQIFLTKRTEWVDTHKGQISFPGGFWEETDASLVQTALRESHEEIGTKPEHIQILGQLQPVITRGGIWIYPWVAQIALPYSFEINTTEVEKVFSLPLNRLVEEGLKPVEVDIGNGKIFKGPGIEVEGELVWGATARMLEQLKRHIKG